MKIKLQQVISAVEMSDDNWTGFYDSQTGESVWIGDKYLYLILVIGNWFDEIIPIAAVFALIFSGLSIRIWNG